MHAKIRFSRDLEKTSTPKSGLSPSGDGANDASLNIHGSTVVKRHAPMLFHSSLHTRPERGPKSMMALEMPGRNLGSSFMAMPSMGPTVSPPPSAMKQVANDAAVFTISTKEVPEAKAKEPPKDLIDINVRRRIASASMQDKLSQKMPYLSGGQFFDYLPEVQAGRNRDPDPATPMEWTRRLSAVLPTQLSDKRQRSREFSDRLCRLNVHMSELPKRDRVNFRRRLEEDGQFLRAIEQARSEFGEYALVRKEIQVYEDDKEDDA
ncbi:uncharacterized protein BKCO1_3300052 [Diplodia corticola]|uniref:Uncharacterized protein n=1 Tax=Diplodia corticola TaxID=236234 RepID=A0A1J9RZD0_9PEZI|nr:uncharacterized protein BKCO1_3300052 [Diplodia corticola]OJD33148.1 hypothetical protein BKCO1_3300052 [Diplodia corticola]